MYLEIYIYVCQQSQYHSIEGPTPKFEVFQVISAIHFMVIFFQTFFSDEKT